MLTKLDFTNAETAVTYSYDVDAIPTSDFDVTVQDRTTTDRAKAQAHGTWPTFPYLGGMEISYEGQILADDATDYITKRKAMAAAMRGNPTNPVTHRASGILKVGLEGESEDWWADVVITAFTPGPVSAPQLWRTAYAVTFFSFEPYFYGGTTPANIYVWS